MSHMMNAALDSMDKASDAPLHGQGSAVFEKWGEAAVAGFQPVPDLLLKNQERLGLSAMDMVVLLNILMHWWYAAQKPYPRGTTIAKRMGVTVRTVQRSIQHLEELGLVVRERAEGGPTYLDPTVLVEKLSNFALTDTDYQVRKGRRNTA